MKTNGTARVLVGVLMAIAIFVLSFPLSIAENTPLIIVGEHELDAEIDALIEKWREEHENTDASDAWDIAKNHSMEEGEEKTHGLPDDNDIPMLAALRLGIIAMLDYEKIEAIAEMKPVIYFRVDGEAPLWQITFLSDVDSDLETYTLYIIAATGELSHIAVGSVG